MTIKFSMMLLAGALTLSACGEESCTEEVATKKAADLQAKMLEVGTADPAKLAALAPKAQEIMTKLQGATDPAEACKAIDELMAELAK